jgi:chromosome segregation ATPase
VANWIGRDEFEARVGVLEREVEGEKIVMRHILQETRRNSDDLAAIKTRLDRVEGKVDGLDRKVDGLDRKVDDLIKELPRMIADTMREVLSERKRK